MSTTTLNASIFGHGITTDVLVAEDFDVSQFSWAREDGKPFRVTADLWHNGVSLKGREFQYLIVRNHEEIELFVDDDHEDNVTFYLTGYTVSSTPPRMNDKKRPASTPLTELEATTSNKADEKDDNDKKDDSGEKALSSPSSTKRVCPNLSEDNDEEEYLQVETNADGFECGIMEDDSHLYGVSRDENEATYRAIDNERPLKLALDLCDENGVSLKGQIFDELVVSHSQPFIILRQTAKKSDDEDKDYCFHVAKHCFTKRADVI